MTAIDLCKLRPGDVLFTREPTATSRWIRGLTLGPYSHAMIVIYPDLWFETTGAGSGFLLITDHKPSVTTTGAHVVVTTLTYSKFTVLRLDPAPAPTDIMEAIRDQIALTYPGWREFIPLIFALRALPDQFVSALMRRITTQPSGDYCSQLVYRILTKILPDLAVRASHHITPSALYRLLKRRPGTNDVSSSVLWRGTLAHEDPRTKRVLERANEVTAHLSSFQYPHNRTAFEAPLKKLFATYGLPFDPSDVGVDHVQLQYALTKPSYLRLHKQIWPSRYT